MFSSSRLSPLAFAVGMFSLTATVSAQDFPNRPVTLIIPWTAGGPTDIVLRSFAEAASKHLGQPIIVENKAGGGGAVGPATMAATAKPDGYTISQITDAAYRIPLMQKTTWNPETDFTYIVNLTGYAFGVIAPADSPFKSWPEVVEFARANPGKVTFGSNGVASSVHMGMERILAKAGVKMTHVPFKGSAETNTAVMGGHVMLGTTGTSARPLYEGGKIKFLNVWTPKRLDFLPDVPTLLELDYGFYIDAPVGIGGPKGMDPKVVGILHDAFKKALDDPAVIETLRKYELIPNYKNSADYRKAILEAMATEREILTNLGMARKD